MLLLEEERLGKGKKPALHKDESSSSPKVLAATTSSADQKSFPQSQQQSRNFQIRGNRGRNRGRGRTNNQQRPQFPQWSTPYWNNGYPMWPQTQFNPWTQLPEQAFSQQ